MNVVGNLIFCALYRIMNNGSVRNGKTAAIRERTA